MRSIPYLSHTQLTVLTQSISANYESDSKSAFIYITLIKVIRNMGHYTLYDERYYLLGFMPNWNHACYKHIQISITMREI